MSFISNSGRNKLVVPLGELVEKGVNLPLDSEERDRDSSRYSCHRTGAGIWRCLPLICMCGLRLVPLAKEKKLVSTPLGSGIPSNDGGAGERTSWPCFFPLSVLSGHRNGVKDDHKYYLNMLLNCHEKCQLRLQTVTIT